MELNESQVNQLEEALQQLEELDPADVPGPAADLAELLSRILEGMETT